MPYSPAVHRWLLCALVASAPAQARADGISIIGGSPRAIGRAGAATVGDDGGGALLINPAAMARRSTTRIEAGASIVEDDVQWQSDTEGAPLSRGQAGSRIAPIGSVIGAVGRWVLGIGAMTSGVSDRSLARPSQLHDLGSSYGYRYTGIAGGYRRDTLSIGAARRLGNSLALGLSLGASRISVTEHRRIWAGWERREAIGDPTSDVDVLLSGTDSVSPSAVAGVLYAPDDTQIELGASVAWARTVRLDGTVTADGDPSTGPTIVDTGPARAQLAVAQPIAVRAGGRYAGDRVVAELDGDLWIARRGSALTAWAIDGVHAIDSTGVDAAVARVPSRISQQTHVALRVSVDVELIPGFLWATTGYAMSTLGTPASRLSPSFGDLGGDTLGLGLEATAGGFTATLGWSRTWAPATAAPSSSLRLDNPFNSGDAAVAAGTYDGSIDQIGVLLEVELGTP
jgi:hypothetical protein